MKLIVITERFGELMANVRRSILKEDIKSLLKFVFGILAFLYIYGTVGSLELDMITVRQALTRCGAVFGAVAIGVVVKLIKKKREKGGGYGKI